MKEAALQNTWLKEWLKENKGHHFSNTYILQPNTDYLYKEKFNVVEFFRCTRLTGRMLDGNKTTWAHETYIDKISKDINNEKKTKTGRHCFSPLVCQFAGLCHIKQSLGALPQYNKVKEPILKGMLKKKQNILVEISAVQHLIPEHFNERPYHYRVMQFGIQKMEENKIHILSVNRSNSDVSNTIAKFLKYTEGETNLVLWHKEVAVDILYDLAEQFPSHQNKLLERIHRVIGVTELYKNFKGFYSGLNKNLHMDIVLKHAAPKYLKLSCDNILSAQEMSLLTQKTILSADEKESMKSNTLSRLKAIKKISKKIQE